MNSVMVRMMVVVVLLLQIGIRIVEAGEVYGACNPSKYNENEQFATDLEYVLKTIVSETRNKGRYLMHWPEDAQPNVYGFAICFVGGDLCTSRLNACIDDIKSNCGNAIGAQVYHNECDLRYEKYKF